MGQSTPSILDLCAGLPEVGFGPGDTIIKEGGLKKQLLVMIEGAVQVSKQEYEISTVRAAGSIFGEMSILLNRYHTATVRALEPSRFFVIKDGLETIKKYPELNLHISRLLATRLDCLNGYLVDIKAQFKNSDGHLSMMDEVIDSLMNQQPS